MGSGSRKERALAVSLDAIGYTPMRAASSGGGTDRALPDVHAAKDGVSYAIEQKYGSDRLYFTYEEMNLLQSFATDFGSEPVAAARFKGDTTFYLVMLSDLPHSGGDSYVLTHDTAKEQSFMEVDDVA